MFAISLDMRRAALIRQDLGRPHVPLAGQSWKDSLIMSQPPLSLTVAEKDKATLAELVDGWYREALLLLQQGERVRQAAGLPLPASASELYSALIPRQAMSR